MEKKHKSNVCEKTFGTRATLGFHIRAKHSGQPFKCQLCGKEFANQRNLKRHTQREHEKIEKVKCPSCEKTFTRKDCMATHVKIAHEGLRFSCSKCDKEFTSFCSLNEHVAWRHENIRKQCKHCEKTFSCTLTLKKHVKSIHEGRRYPCSSCEKSYNYWGGLWRHKISVHEKIRFPCTVCNATFSQKYRLGIHIKCFHPTEHDKTILENRHIVKNSVDNPLKCDNCDRTFKMRIALKKHAAKCSHQTNPKEITIERNASQCDLCDFTTDDLQKLYRHSVETHMTATD